MRSNLPRIFLLIAFLLLSGQACIRFSGGSPTGPTFLRSDDQGSTWTPKDFVGQVKVKKKTQTITLTSVSANLIVFSRLNPSLVFLATENNGLYVSTNRGDQWHPLGYRTAVRSFALDPTSDATMYVTGGQTIQKSLDSGQTWQPLFTVTRSGEILTTLGVDFYNPKRVLAGTNTGILYRSEDAGLTWNIFATIPDAIDSLQFSPNDSRIIYLRGAGQGIWKSTDGGQTWTSLAPSLAQFPGALANLRLSILQTNSNHLYLTSGYGLLRSFNGGSSWETIRTLLPPPQPMDGAVVNPTDENTVTFLVGTKLHRTADGGQSWQVSTVPVTRPVVLLRDDPTDPNVLYLAMRLPPKK